MKKKIVRWILPVCMMLLLAGCGKSSNTVVTGTYYNPSKDAENTAQTVGTEADANDVLDAMEQGTEQEGTSIGADLFLITNNDMQAECLILTQLNSGKQYMEQIRIAKEVLHSRRHSDDIKNLVKGLMIESYIEPGSQKIGEHCYGKSITDPCLSWDDTERLLYDIAELS